MICFLVSLQRNVHIIGYFMFNKQEDLLKIFVFFRTSVFLDKCEMKLWVPISLTASHISRELSSSLALYQPKHKDDNELIALQSCIYYQPITFVGFIVI